MCLWWIICANFLSPDIFSFFFSVEEDLNQLLKSRGLAEATCVLLQMEQLSGDLQGSQLAVAMAEMAKTSGKQHILFYFYFFSSVEMLVHGLGYSIAYAFSRTC